MSIDLVQLLAAEWTESDKHIKLIGLMTITMKKNNSDQTKGKPWTEEIYLKFFNAKHIISNIESSHSDFP